VLKSEKALQLLGDLYAEMDINRAWEIVGQNIKISAEESLDCYEAL
jgi:hypothetical protein